VDVKGYCYYFYKIYKNFEKCLNSANFAIFDKNKAPEKSEAAFISY